MVDFGAEHVREEGRADAAVAVLSGEAAAVLFDQVSDVAGDVVKVLAAGAGLEVENGAEVDLPGAGVGVVDRLLPVALHEGFDLGDVVGQIG